jgi:hypothetical protein
MSASRRAIIRNPSKHAQGQHIVWQQFLIKVKNTFPSSLKSKGDPYKDWMHRIQKSNQ